MVQRFFRPSAILVAASVLLLSMAGFLGPAHAKALSSPLVVVELFTSQGCAACRPADNLLAELNGRDDVLVLSLHVDTWDYAGWQDPFALSEATQRQKRYADLMGRATAYTPEMVINGITHIPGLDPVAVERVVESAALRAAAVPIEIGHDAEHRLKVSIANRAIEGEATIWLAVIDRKHATDVVAGENRGTTIVNYNVVRAMKRIGKWSGSALDLHLPSAQTRALWEKGEGCAVLLQLDATGEILGAQILWFHD